MRRIYEFKCPEHGVFEKYIDESVTEQPCIECEVLSPRVISSVRCSLEGVSGSFPGAYFQWEAKRNQKIAQERKKNEG